MEIHLGNGNSEQVEFVPGSTFKIFGNRLQFPANTQAGKSVVWNNIKGNIGVRWYDIVLDKTDKVTRAYEHELRHIQEGDVVPTDTWHHAQTWYAILLSGCVPPT